MAYEFKKLSEVEKLDSVPEGASVLAEVDGVIRRVPGDGLGGSGAIPYFDLVAMGLPAIPLDGTTVSVECDTTELRAAAAKGLVKAKFGISVPNIGTLEYENILSMGYLALSDAYTYSGVMEVNLTAFVITCTVTTTDIACSAIPLATATT